jgi:hypothetical protein
MLLVKTNVSNGHLFLQKLLYVLWVKGEHIFKNHNIGPRLKSAEWRWSRNSAATASVKTSIVLRTSTTRLTTIPESCCQVNTLYNHLPYHPRYIQTGFDLMTPKLQSLGTLFTYLFWFLVNLTHTHTQTHSLTKNKKWHKLYKYAPTPRFSHSFPGVSVITLVIFINFYRKNHSSCKPTLWSINQHEKKFAIFRRKKIS